VNILLRFRHVCKAWCSLISHDSHFQLAASPTYRILFLSPEALSIDFDASLNDHSSDINLHFLPRSRCPEIAGSCRGFLLLNTHRGLYLRNPSTGVHKQIPDSPITISENQNIVEFLYGFAYEPTTDDYIVVLVSYGML
jgi:hypothetical protein